MARKTQKQAVLEWLQTGAGITSMEAFRELGVTRLSAIIFNLRKDGHDIEGESIESVSRFGAKVKFTRYRLKK